LENIVSDLTELEKGMEIVRKEQECRKERILRDFLHNSEEKLKKLRGETRVAQEAFRICVEYFGESPRTSDANSFFSLILRFVKAFKVIYVNKVFFYFY
jgi:hypothetical protein